MEPMCKYIPESNPSVIEFVAQIGDEALQYPKKITKDELLTSYIKGIYIEPASITGLINKLYACWKR